MKFTFSSPAIIALSVLPVTYGTPSISAPPPLSTITVAGQIFIVNPADPILNSRTVRPGSAGISINRQVVSADAAEDLYVDGTKILAGPTGGTSAGNTTANRMPHSSSVSASSFSTTAAGLSFLPQVVSQIAEQANSNHSIHSGGDLVTLSGSGSISVPSLSSSGTASSGVVTTSLASSFMMNSFPSESSPNRATSNVPTDPQWQSLGVGSKSTTASTSKVNLSPTGLSIHSNISSGLLAFPAVPPTSQGISSSTNPMSLAGASSLPTMSVPGSAQPNTITTGPNMASPSIALNPTGSIASSQGILLIGGIFEITKEAKTLSAVIKDDGPRQSFIAKIKGTDDDINNLLEDLHPPSPPPSYEDTCLNGGSILGIINILGCLKSGFDEVASDLHDEPPNVNEIQSKFDNLGQLAENLEKEEDDNNEETSAQDTATKASSTSTNTPSSITSIASSSSATATVVTQNVDTNLVVDRIPSDNHVPNIPDEAIITFIGDVLFSAMGIGPSLSGFTSIFGSVNATLTSNSSAATTMPPSITAVGALSSSLSTAFPAVSSGIPGGAVAQPSSNSSAGNLASETTRHTGQLASIQAPASSATATSNAAARAKAVEGIEHDISDFGAKASATAVDSSSPSTSTPLTSGPPSAPAPPSTSSPGPQFAIYLAYQTFTQGGPGVYTDFYYKIWVTDLTAHPAGPDFCAPESWIWNKKVNEVLGAGPPYPTKDFPFIIPQGDTGAGSLAVSCVWEPSPDKSQPGSVSCDPGEVALCSVPVTTEITCHGNDPNQIEPLAQCVFK